MTQRKISWEECTLLTSIIADKLNALNITPDCIIAVGRGGMIPATLLSYKTKITPIFSLGISTRHGSTKLYQKLPDRVWEYKNILIVDDINDTGKTFDMVLLEIPEEFKGEATFCSLLKRYSTKFDVCTICGDIEPTDRWIVFPWD